jgi:putative ABC transport system permease protein
VQRRGLTTTEEEEQRAQSNPRVTLDDAEAIRAFSPKVALVMAEAGNNAQVKYRGETLDSIRVRGVTKEFNNLPSTSVERGRAITPTEFDNGRLVTVLGWGTADRLFGVLEAVDKLITIGGIRFRVVGVAPQKGSVFGESQDEFAVIPLAAYQRLYGSRQSLSLTVRPTDPSLTDSALDDARAALRVERRLRPKEPDNFGLLTSDTFLNLYRQMTTGIFTILIGVVSLSLVVGGIVIMNIMLMVVSERTREIGLRKALGARRRDIVWQILTESVTLSIFGGLVGIGLGFGLALLISKLSPLPAAVQAWSVMMGIGITALVGLFFGLYPAMRAASLDPIEALRRE